nr:MAG: replication initiator protein [Microvirus sp.]
MACLFPQERYRAPGSKKWHNNPYRGHIASQIQPCGHCIECRFSTIVRPWTVRGLKELRYHDKASFVTLTYDKAHLPPNSSLDRRHVKAWARELLLAYPDARYLYCGEYGGKFGRPHYHAIVFGADFGYKPSSSRSYSEHGISVAQPSNELASMWRRGFSSVGNVTADSIAYVASYCLKKINGPAAASHYGDRLPEFLQQSKRAIGKRYAEDFKDELLRHANIPHDGYTVPVPRYFRRNWSDAEKKVFQNTLDKTPLPRPLLRDSIARIETLARKFGDRLSPKYVIQLNYLRDLESRLGCEDSPSAIDEPVR